MAEFRCGIGILGLLSQAIKYKSLRHSISMAFYILNIFRLYTWLSPGVGSGAVGTHRAILQLQGHGSQEKPGPQVMAAHAPKSGQGVKLCERFVRAIAT